MEYSSGSGPNQEEKAISAGRRRIRLVVQVQASYEDGSEVGRDSGYEVHLTQGRYRAWHWSLLTLMRQLEQQVYADRDADRLRRKQMKSGSRKGRRTR